MRFLGFAVLTSAVIALSACGGDKAPAADSAGASTAAVTPTPEPAAATPGTMAPVTGTTHEVKMIVDAAGAYKFDPAEITIKAGDGIRWTMVSGGPHNVAFDPATTPAAAKTALAANMPEQMSELMSKMLTQPNETYMVSFANVPAGTYEYNCTPHLAMGMKGKITVTQ